MKIVQINAVFGFGSTGIIVQDLQNLCIRNGIDCVVAYSKSYSFVEKGYKIGNIVSNKLHALMSRICGKQGYFSFFSTKKFLNFLNDYKPDIIHLHNLHACYINLPMLLKFAIKKNITVVVTLHDCWFYTGGCSHYTSVGCSRWMHKCGSCPQRYSETPAYIADSSDKILQDRKFLFGDLKKLAVVGVSKWISDEARKTVFKNATNITIHNGVDVDFFHPVSSNFRERYNLENKKLILAPANKWFLEVNRDTFDFFASKITDDIRVIFIGSGCNENLLTDKMINYGYVSSREELREIYSAVDVMVNCTREESLSLLNIEVQACGTPVITYSNTGVKETVNGHCGFAIENGNKELLWNQTINVLNKGKDYYSKDCIQWVNSSFNREENYRKYLKLYNSLESNK